MKTVAAFVLLAVCLPHAPVVNAQSDAPHGVASAPPASLDALYPPKAPMPLYVAAMYGMNQPLAGVVVDLNEGDREGMLANYARFREEYEKTSAMVPEWRGQYPEEPVAALGAAVESGDPGAVMAAVESVAGVCHNCHVVHMAPVQHKYHWPDFQMMTVSDPVSGRDLDWAGLMQMLNVTLTGIAVDLEQGQTENAQKQWQGFAALFSSLKETCQGCHDTERMYYVDARMQSVVDQLGAALAGPQVDAAAVADLSQKIGMGTCTGCHLVHVPAAMAAMRAH